MSTSFITPWHVRAFQAVMTQDCGDVTLASCLINGKPGALFVAMSDDMEIVFEGEVGGASSEGGGPRRNFAAAKDLRRPSRDIS
jgi:hypothetical protein